MQHWVKDGGKQHEIYVATFGPIFFFGLFLQGNPWLNAHKSFSQFG